MQGEKGFITLTVKRYKKKTRLSSMKVCTNLITNKVGILLEHDEVAPVQFPFH